MTAEKLTLLGEGLFSDRTVIREIYKAFFETNQKDFRNRVLLSRSRDRLCSLCGERKSRIAGISKRTLQFYDDEGVVKAERSGSNYRLYDERALGELWEVMIYKEAGMELKEIKQLMRAPEQEKKLFYQMYIKSLEEKIKRLEGQREWISFIMTHGFPKVPENEEGVTYKERIAELSCREPGGEAGSCRKTAGESSREEKLKDLRNPAEKTVRYF